MRLTAACAQIDELQELMQRRVPSWLGFCHNDLQYGNMLLHVSSPEVSHGASDARHCLNI